MPRKTTRTLAHGFPVTPYHLGPKLIDSEGDEVTIPERDAVRVVLAPGGGLEGEDGGPVVNVMGDIQDSLDEQLEELKRIRRANEFILGQEVKRIED